MNFEQDLRAEYARLTTRRWFFRQCGVGLGSIALGSLLGADRVLGATKPAAANPPGRAASRSARALILAALRARHPVAGAERCLALYTLVYSRTRSRFASTQRR